MAVGCTSGTATQVVELLLAAGAEVNRRNGVRGVHGLMRASGALALPWETSRRSLVPLTSSPNHSADIIAVP